MINLDAWLLEFVKMNWMTITAAGVLVKGIADANDLPWLTKLVHSVTSILPKFRGTK